jgi:hypothetical protein
MQAMTALVEQRDDIIVGECGGALLFTLAERRRKIAIQIGDRGLNFSSASVR